MKIDFEYGQGTMTAELPDNTDIFIPGETVKDPDYIPEDKLEEAYLESLAHPIGMPTLTELAHKGSTVTFIVPDRVKGGEQATSHRKLSIKYILRELYAAGVEKKDILFIISNGLHPRSKESDAKAIFGEELFNEFWHTGQISGGGFCFQHFHHLVSGGVGRPLLEKARHHKDCVAYPRFGHAVRAAGRAFVSLGVGHRQISFPASSRFSCSIFPCAAAFLKFSPVKQRGEHISSRRS